MITFNELLERTKTEKIAIHTPAEEQAITLLSELCKKGYTWFSTYSLITETFYGEYKENTCYSLHEHYKFSSIKKVMYGPLNHYQDKGYTIIECGDIEWMENNMTGGNMTNREWLATLSDEDFVNWLYVEPSIFFDPRTFEVVAKAVYHPTKTEVTMGWNSYSDRMLQWLGEERKD